MPTHGSRRFRAPTLRSVTVSFKNAVCLCMIKFDYKAPAELFAAQGRQGLRYRRFFNAGEAMTASKSARFMKAKAIP
jgi:hypothetical protein